MNETTIDSVKNFIRSSLDHLERLNDETVFTVGNMKQTLKNILTAFETDKPMRWVDNRGVIHNPNLIDQYIHEAQDYHISSNRDVIENWEKWRLQKTEQEEK